MIRLFILVCSLLVSMSSFAGKEDCVSADGGVYQAVQLSPEATRNITNTIKSDINVVYKQTVIKEILLDVLQVDHYCSEAFPVETEGRNNFVCINKFTLFGKDLAKKVLTIDLNKSLNCEFLRVLSE